MKSSKSQEIKVGIVTLVAITLFIIGIMLGNDYRMSVDTVNIKMRFPTSGGIEQSAPVFVNGVKRGRVTEVMPDNGNVLVFAEIDNIKDLKEDVSARLGILEITGGKKIDLTPGQSNNQFNINNEIAGITSPDIGEMIALVGEMGADAKVLLKKLDTIATAASKLLTDGRLDKTLTNTSEMTEALNTFVKSNIRSLELIVSNMKVITNDIKAAIDKYEPKADSLFRKVDNTVEDTRKLLKSADGAIANANKLINELTLISEDIKKSEGLAGKLIYDKKFADKMDSTIQSLSDFLLMIKEYGLNINARVGTRP